MKLNGPVLEANSGRRGVDLVLFRQVSYYALLQISATGSDLDPFALDFLAPRLIQVTSGVRELVLWHQDGRGAPVHVAFEPRILLIT